MRVTASGVCTLCTPYAAIWRDNLHSHELCSDARKVKEHNKKEKPSSLLLLLLLLLLWVRRTHLAWTLDTSYIDVRELWPKVYECAYQKIRRHRTRFVNDRQQNALGPKIFHFFSGAKVKVNLRLSWPSVSPSLCVERARYFCIFLYSALVFFLFRQIGGTHKYNRTAAMWIRPNSFPNCHIVTARKKKKKNEQPNCSFHLVRTQLHKHTQARTLAHTPRHWTHNFSTREIVNVLKRNHIFLLLITLFIQGKSSIHWRFYSFTAEFSICCESQCISLVNCSSFQHLHSYSWYTMLHTDFSFIFASVLIFFLLMGIHLFWLRSQFIYSLDPPRALRTAQ